MSRTLRFGIALGSNEGDRLAHLRAALAWLQTLDASPRLSVSRIYETDPVDCAPGSPSFLNAVCEISSALAPRELLRRVREFERARGRPNARAKNSPRPLDLDLLYADDVVLQTATLTLPHPRMTARRFVLQPLDDLRPGLVLPGERKTVRELLARLPPVPRVFLHPEPVR